MLPPQLSTGGTPIKGFVHINCFSTGLCPREKQHVTAEIRRTEVDRVSQTRQKGWGQPPGTNPEGREGRHASYRGCSALRE